MTCQECELALGLEQNVDDHLAVCTSCQALAEEIRSNAMAFESFADDPLPTVRYRVMALIRSQSNARRVMRWGWVLAAAAIVVVLIYVWPHRKAEVAGEKRAPRPAGDLLIAPVEVGTGASNTPARRSGDRLRARGPTPHPAEVLRVKLLTDDPDVVIYWLVEKKEGAE